MTVLFVCNLGESSELSQELPKSRSFEFSSTTDLFIVLPFKTNLVV